MCVVLCSLQKTLRIVIVRQIVSGFGVRGMRLLISRANRHSLL